MPHLLPITSNERNDYVALRRAATGLIFSFSKKSELDSAIVTKFRLRQKCQLRRALFQFVFVENYLNSLGIFGELGPFNIFFSSFLVAVFCVRPLFSYKSVVALHMHGFF